MSKFDLSRFPPYSKVRILEDIPPRLHFISEHATFAKEFRYKPNPEFVKVPNYRDFKEEQVGLMINVLVPVVPAQWIKRMVPRKHRRRSGQTEASHQRIQKKWKKRDLQVEVTERVMKPAVMLMSRMLAHKIHRKFGTEAARPVGDDLHLDMYDLGYNLLDKGDPL